MKLDKLSWPLTFCLVCQQIYCLCQSLRSYEHSKPANKNEEVAPESNAMFDRIQIPTHKHRNHRCPARSKEMEDSGIPTGCNRSDWNPSVVQVASADRPNLNQPDGLKCNDRVETLIRFNCCEEKNANIFVVVLLWQHEIVDIWCEYMNIYNS